MPGKKQNAGLTKLPDSTLLGEARLYLRTNIRKGVSCPCCTQRVQQYERPITSAMAYGLILLYRHYKKNFHPFQINTYVHLESILKETPDIPSSIRGDMSKLKYWDIILPNPDQDGYYKLTDKGIAFIKGEIRVESHAILFNNKFYGFKGELVGISECLKNKFDFNKLMEGIL